MAVSFRDLLKPAAVDDVEAAKRRQALAEAMYAKHMSPNIPQAGGPVQAKYGVGNALVDLANSLAGAWNLKQANESVRTSENARAAALTDATKQLQNAGNVGAAAVERLRQTPDGQLAEPVTDDDIAARTNEAQRRVASAMGPGGPQALAEAVLARSMERPKPAEPFTLGEAQVRYDGAGREIARGPDKKSADKFERIEKPLPNGLVQDYVFNEKSGAYEKWGDPYKPIDKSPNVTVRTGGGAPPRWVQAQDPTDPNRKVWVNLNDPNAPPGPLSGEETAGGKRENTRRFAMGGINDAISEARVLLSGTGDAKPTDSGVGTLIDKAGAFVGASPDGAKQADRLRVIGGVLTSKVPRFEGPQSNFDVQLYQQMAAQVGDSTVPVERRLAALQTMEELLAKYEGLGQEPFPGATTTSAAPSGGTAAPPSAVGNPTPAPDADGWTTLPNGVRIREKR